MTVVGEMEEANIGGCAPRSNRALLAGTASEKFLGGTRHVKSLKASESAGRSP